MRSTILRTTISIPAIVLALSSFAPSVSAVTLNRPAAADCQSWNFKAEASTLLKQVQSLSGRLKYDSKHLESLGRNPGRSWEGHAYQLSVAREHINKIGDRLDRLQAIQRLVAPWQQRAIAQIVPAAAGLADHTQAAIKHLNDNRTDLFAPDYTDHLMTIADGSGELKSTLDRYLEYGSVSERHQQLEQLRDNIAVTVMES